MNGKWQYFLNSLASVGGNLLVLSIFVLLFLYSGAISISSSVTLKVVGGGTGYNDSSASINNYVIQLAPTATVSPIKILL